MRILIFAEIYYPDIMGGGEFSTKQMTEGLAKKGHEVTVYCLGKNTREEEINGVLVKRKYLRGLSEHFSGLAKNDPSTDAFSLFEKIIRKRADLYPDRSWYEYYRSVIMKEDPDVVHTASPMSYLGRMNLWKAAYDLGIPVSHVCRGPNLLTLNFPGGVSDTYNRCRNARASMYLTALAAPSRYMLDIHNRAGIRGQRFNEVIYNAVDFDPILPGKELVEKKENMILYAGELSEKKGIRTLIRAAEGLGGTVLLLIGEGELSGRIKISEKVEAAGWMEREELYACMQRAKAVILPSKWDEPFGRILMEAICNGTVAIGSDRGGIPEVLGHNEDHIFKSGDAEGLKSRIERVLCMTGDRYIEEVKKQQDMAPCFTDGRYTDDWEAFFLRQPGSC